MKTYATKRRRIGARLADERGQSMLEIALTLPILLLVSVSIFEFGRAYQYSQILTNAAREGARVAIVASTSEEDIRNRVSEYMKSGNLKTKTAEEGFEIAIDRTIPIDAGGASATGSEIVVKYPFEFMVLNPVAKLIVSGSTTGKPITITATAQMRNES